MKSFVMIFILLATLSATAEILEGVAKNLKGEIVYLEKHFIERDDKGLNKFIRVEYSKPDGTRFAEMTSDFANSKTVPETVFTDQRFKSKAYIRLIKNFVEFEEIKDGKSVGKKSLPFNESMVASQGFDNFIQMNFSELQAKPIEFKFGVIDSKDFFSLTGYRKPASSGGDLEFGIKASSWLVRLFAAELKVVYNAAEKKLKSFSGRSNILDDAGKPQDVVITYQWKDAS